MKYLKRIIGIRCSPIIREDEGGKHSSFYFSDIEKLLHDFSEDLIGKDEKVNPLHGNCEVCTPKCARNQFRAERREKRDKLLGMKK